MLGGAALGGPRSQTTYMKTRAAGTYPDFFAASVREQRPDWIVVANVQTSNFGKFFGSDWDDIQAAFEDFGQVTLLDKRPGREGDPIHMMDTGTLPPIGYHRWHAAIRLLNCSPLAILLGGRGLIRGLASPGRFSLSPDLISETTQTRQNPNLTCRLCVPPGSPWHQNFEMRNSIGRSKSFVGYHPSPMQPVAVAIV